MVKLFKAKKANKHSRPVKNQLRVDSLDHTGVGVSRGKTVTFISGALPGELCDVTILSHRKGIQQAKLNNIIEGSDQRIEAFCQHYSECGGCQLQHIADEHTLTHKRGALDYMLSRSVTMSELPWQPSITADSRNYRRKARLAINARHGQFSVGFRRSNNEVFSLSDCQVLTTPLQRLIEPITTLLSGLSLRTHLGHVTLLDVEPQVTVVLRITRPMNKKDQARCLAFQTEFNCRLLLEPETGQYSALDNGHSDCFYSLLGLSFQFASNDFIQVNHVINESMVRQALNWLNLHEDDRVLDLFCGIGNFSLPMAQRCRTVVGIEGVDAMVDKALSNAQRNDIDNVTFLQADLNQANSLADVADEHRPNKVLLDPARAGAFEVMPQLVRLQVSEVVYVSCNPATLARDIKVLVNGGYTLTKIALVNMFPNTAHTEMMAHFSRHSQ